jgi:simple sugar transport system permease protein
MTATTAPTGPPGLGAPTEPTDPADPSRSSRGAAIARGLGRAVVAVAGAVVIFGVFMKLKGADPIAAYRDMWDSTFTSTDSLEQILVKATPLIFAALAVTVPARAGLVNVGGEGQLVVGGVGAAAVVMWFGHSMPTGVVLVLMAVFGALAGAVWAGIAALLRMTVQINEAVTTLLLNYVAVDLMLYLIYDPWKDLHGSGQPATPPLTAREQLPLIGDSTVSMGFLIAVVATAVVWFVLTRTSWGFRLSVVGGNPEAARQAGLRVGMLLLTSMLVGGALAGLGGFTQLAGVEHKLRPGFLLTYGYIGFLASWLARHHPVRVALAATLLAAIAVGGDSLQLDSALPAASVNVLMALVLLGVFGWGARKKAVAA